MGPLTGVAELNEAASMLHRQVRRPTAAARQESILARAGMALARSTLAVDTCRVQLQPLVDALKQEVVGHWVLHADETPVAMLAPGMKKTHKAYLWAYCPGVFEDMKAVVYDFAPRRAGEHAQAFLRHDDGAAWQASLAATIVPVTSSRCD